MDQGHGAKSRRARGAKEEKSSVPRMGRLRRKRLPSNEKSRQLKVAKGGAKAKARQATGRCSKATAGSRKENQGADSKVGAAVASKGNVKAGKVSGEAKAESTPAKGKQGK